MTATFCIDRQWESALHEVPEVRHTAAMLRIVVGSDVITRNEDEWAQTVRDEVRLSAYPLALWLASSWWRLRWEPLPISRSIPSQSWRMAHEMSAAGYGYVWPRMLFASDGECVNVWASASRPESKQVVRYLSSTFDAVLAPTFERAVDEFIEGVLARLDATKVERTTLYDLWMEISGERKEKKLSLQRRLEALLGFDPDECPESILRDLESLIPRAGGSAVDDIAPVCASADPAATLKKVLSMADADGLNGRINLNLPKVGSNTAVVMPSWHRGRELARHTRASLGLNGSPVSDGNLCDVLGLQVERALNVQGTSRPPLSLAIRKNQSKEIKFIVRKRNRPGRRFELARFLCDYLIAGESDRWFPVSDAKTSRQRTQRAFAAEFLCPIQALEEFMSGDFSADMVEEAADHFEVAPAAVQTQLVNNRLLPAEVLSEYGGGVELPYFQNSRYANADNTLGPAPA
jgi:hypothetical protein